MNNYLNQKEICDGCYNCNNYLHDYYNCQGKSEKVCHEYDPIEEDMKRFIYKEDHQMYYFTPIVFETDAKISIEKMQKISYEPIGAGRVSTNFETFKKFMEEYGYVVNEIERLSENKIPDNNILEIVVGATGNY